MEVSSMYKHFLSIILVLVMVCSMTSCSSNTVSSESTDSTYNTTYTSFEEDQNDLSEESQIDLSEENVNSTISKYYSIDLINPTVFAEMSVDDVELFMSEMVTFSSTNTLTVSDMLHMGHNFNNILSFVPDIDPTVFESYVFNGFNNVYNQCINQDIPLEKLSSWTNIPVAKVQTKYFSSEFTFAAEYLSCDALYYLNENDALTVAETIFNNPTLFENCAGLIYNSIMCPHQKVQQIALDALTSFSNTSNEIDYSIAFNYCLILDTNSIANNVFTIDALNQIRANIISNPNLDFTMKYYVFCNSTDENVSNWAKEILANIASQCDENTEKYIIDLVPYLSDVSFSNSLLELLGQC